MRVRSCTTVFAEMSPCKIKTEYDAWCYVSEHLGGGGRVSPRGLAVRGGDTSRHGTSWQPRVAAAARWGGWWVCQTTPRRVVSNLKNRPLNVNAHTTYPLPLL